MKYISPWYYGNEAMEINQWKEVEEIPCIPPDRDCLPTGLQVLEHYSMDKVAALFILL